MKQILIATHGKMASGIRYTLELVVGKMAEITTMDAYVNPEDDVEKMLQDYFSNHEGDRIYAFTDMKGGSVNQKLMLYVDRPEVTLITGLNLPILLQVALAGEELTDQEIDSFVEAARQELQVISLTPAAGRTVSGGAAAGAAGAGADGTASGGAGQGTAQTGGIQAGEAVSGTYEDSQAKITALRVDDRLIHGQVAMTWTKQLKVDGIIVANDDAAGDPTQKMALKMAVPAGIRVLVKPVDEAIRVLNYEKASKMRILVLTRTIRDALAVRKSVGEIGFLNVGNVGRFDGIDISQKKVLTPTIMLTQDEIECLEELIRIAPDTCMQQVPGDEQKLVKDVIGKVK